MKFIGRMGGNPHPPYQEVDEPLGLSRAGRSVSVSSMPLKDTDETRGKPSRRRVWLKEHMVSSNEAGFDLRGMRPLPQHLARWGSGRVSDVGKVRQKHRGSLGYQWMA
jgi:hypothetical protein